MPMPDTPAESPDAALSHPASHCISPALKDSCEKWSRTSWIKWTQWSIQRASP